MNYEIRYGTAAPQRYADTFLFVVSHLRSYSSLLCHILGNHPEISGYSEMHQSYLGATTLTGSRSGFANSLEGRR
jgi:hypothetical protein